MELGTGLIIFTCDCAFIVRVFTRQRKSFVSYKKVSEIPKEAEVRDLQIYVDRARETLILPVFGSAVPFHISSIKVYVLVQLYAETEWCGHVA